MHCNRDFLLVNIIPMGISKRLFLVPLQPIDISVRRTFIPTLTYDICSVYALSLSWKTPFENQSKTRLALGRGLEKMKPWSSRVQC